MVAVIYFSRRGKNKQDGRCQYINVGNTEVVAQKIGLTLNVKPIEIKPLQAYPVDYFETKARSHEEYLNGTQVPIASVDFDITDNLIILGFPNWWGTMPQAVKTFLTKYDLGGKKIYPFVTHEGSQFGKSLDDLKQLTPDSLIMKGLPVRGTRAYKSESSITNWLENMNLN